MYVYYYNCNFHNTQVSEISVMEARAGGGGGGGGGGWGAPTQKIL
jgi:hypothetical protein